MIVFNFDFMQYLCIFFFFFFVNNIHLSHSYSRSWKLAGSPPRVQLEVRVPCSSVSRLTAGEESSVSLLTDADFFSALSLLKGNSDSPKGIKMCWFFFFFFNVSECFNFMFDTKLLHAAVTEFEGSDISLVSSTCQFYFWFYLKKS